MKTALGLVCWMLFCVQALAQSAPFDMTPERPVPVPEITTPETPVPPDVPPATVPEEAPVEVQEETVPGPSAEPARRYILPANRIVLSGEIASRSWVMHLTDRQAASANRFHLSYQDAVVVAPEGSHLEIFFNGVLVVNEAVSASDRLKELAVDIPPGALRPGRNDVTVRAQHRHRTDCTVESTYELWTEIQAAGTFLTFTDPTAGDLRGFTDIRTLGPDTAGRARISIIAPSLATSDIAGDVMTLSQAVALQSGLPAHRFRISATLQGDPEAEQDGLRVLLGSADELERLVGALPPAANTGPFAAFLPQIDGIPTFIVTGRNRQEWNVAIERLVSPVSRPVGSLRDVLSTETWRAPNAPMAYEGRQISFADLGIRSEQFSGRRYSRSFAVGIPADFYADSYGQARILLDAAYSDAVLPGSLINIYVNGNIAASFPITTRRGTILNRFPIKVAMHHFRPGLNDIVLDVNILTNQDEACLPGATSDQTPRLAIFETSSLVIPDFARIAQRPNLAALAGTAFPYGLGQSPVSIVVERDDPENLSAVANILARMAMESGRVMPVTFTSSVDSVRGQNTLFVGTADGMPPSVLKQVAIDESEAESWAAAQRGVSASQQTDQISVDQWRLRMTGGGLRGMLKGLEQWLSDTFNITVDMLRFVPGEETAIVPPPIAALFVAQGINPMGNGVWTVIATADQATLNEGASAMSSYENWRALSGNVTLLGRDLQTITSFPVVSSSFYETQPPSLRNYRLIVANWLSSNILSYSLLLVVACIVLGVVTSALLSRFGRRH